MGLISRMNTTLKFACFACCLAALAIQPSFGAEAANEIPIWPGTAPGEKGDIGEEHDITKPTDELIAGKRVIRLGNVSTPTMTVYSPSSEKNTGAAVLVCPGGGYHILAMDLEGTEVCAWLNSIGVTGVLLKYRVPKRQGEEGHTAPLQDAQRAMGLVRQHAKEWGVDPKHVGVLGFSAGGHLAAALSNNYDHRLYPGMDEADEKSCKPDFTILIYPGGLTMQKENDQLAPDLKVSTNTPRTFMAMASDDPVRVENALYYALALRKSKVPVELHVYPSGGHGYGLRRRLEAPVTTWPDRATEWMASQGFIGGK